MLMTVQRGRGKIQGRPWAASKNVGTGQGVGEGLLQGAAHLQHPILASDPISAIRGVLKPNAYSLRETWAKKKECLHVSKQREEM